MRLGWNTYYVYILSNVSRMLYIGVTNDLQARVAQHKKKLIQGFTAKYNLFLLVYFEEFSDVNAAIRREKQLKGWLRAKKIALILERNPAWSDLSEGWNVRPHETSSSLGSGIKPCSS